MTFGDPKDFAIEAYHEPYGPKWGGFGRMAIDIQGVRLGNIRENHCSLFDAVERFRSKCNYIEDLWTDSFDGLSDVEIFTLVDTYYTGEPSDQDYSICNFLTNCGEQFDGFKTFIICSPDRRVRILFQFRDGTIGSASCSVDSFCGVAETFIRWFDEQVRTTAPPFFPINPFDLNEKVPDETDG